MLDASPDQQIIDGFCATVKSSKTANYRSNDFQFAIIPFREEATPPNDLIMRLQLGFVTFPLGCIKRNKKSKCNNWKKTKLRRKTFSRNKLIPKRI